MSYDRLQQTREYLDWEDDEAKSKKLRTGNSEMFSRLTPSMLCSIASI